MFSKNLERVHLTPLSILVLLKCEKFDYFMRSKGKGVQGFLCAGHNNIISLIPCQGYDFCSNYFQNIRLMSVKTKNSSVSQYTYFQNSLKYKQFFRIPSKKRPISVFRPIGAPPLHTK